MQELDKAAMGRRIRQIRAGAGLRQWELAKLLGTTQSAVHKYEHGVVPEPRRLLELARVGNTTLEWVLTGRHWDSGSDEQQRLEPTVLQTATTLRAIADVERAAVEEALGIVRSAVEALGAPQDADDDELATRAALLRDHGAETLHLFESAWRIQRAILRRVTVEARRRIGSSGNGGSPD